VRLEAELVVKANVAALSVEQASDVVYLSLPELPGGANVICSEDAILLYFLINLKGSLAMPGIRLTLGVHNFYRIICFQLALSSFSFRGVYERPCLCPGNLNLLYKAYDWCQP